MQRELASTLEEAPCPHTFTIVCGVAGLINPTAKFLEEVGLRFDPRANRVLVIDAPLNFARQQLKQLDGSSWYTVAVTANLCPEYIEDLWERQPTILIAGVDVQQEVTDAMLHVVHGRRYRSMPGEPSPLTVTERAILRYIAWGWETKQIAVRLGLAEKTVRNKLSVLYAALNQRNRSDATRYYFDLKTFGDDP